MDSLYLIFGFILGLFGSIIASFFFWKLLLMRSAKLKIFGKLILSSASNDRKIRIAFLIYDSKFRKTILTDLDIYAYLIGNVNGDKYQYFDDGKETLKRFPIMLKLSREKLPFVEYYKNEYNDNWAVNTVAVELRDVGLWFQLRKRLNKNNEDVKKTFKDFRKIFSRGNVNKRSINKIDDMILLEAFKEIFSSYFDCFNFAIIGQDPFSGLRKITKRTIKGFGIYDCSGRVDWGKLMLKNCC